MGKFKELEIFKAMELIDCDNMAVSHSDFSYVDSERIADEPSKELKSCELEPHNKL